MQIGTSDRIAGAALIVAAALSMLVMAHHPTSAQATLMGEMVHGAMITLIAIIGYGLTHMARRIGLDRPLVLAGLIALMIGIFGDIGAGTINGFVVTALAAKGPIDPNIASLAWEANQALARLGVAATGAAYLLWSIGFVRQGGWARWLGLFGILAGVVPFALLATGLLRMNLHGAIPIYAGQSIWAVLAGLYLWSGRFTADRSLNANSGM